MGLYRKHWETTASVLTTREIFHDELRIYEGSNGFDLVDPAQLNKS